MSSWFRCLCRINILCSSSVYNSTSRSLSVCISRLISTNSCLHLNSTIWKADAAPDSKTTQGVVVFWPTSKLAIVFFVLIFFQAFAAKCSSWTDWLVCDFLKQTLAVALKVFAFCCQVPTEIFLAPSKYFCPLGGFVSSWSFPLALFLNHTLRTSPLFVQLLSIVFAGARSVR